MKHWRQTLATYVYNHCNIQIYFYSIYIKHLQYISKTSETFLKCELTIYIVSRCGHLRRLHRGVAVVAAYEVGGLPHQGLSLLLALAAAVVSLGRTGTAGRMAEVQEQRRTSSKEQQKVARTAKEKQE